MDINKIKEKADLESNRLLDLNNKKQEIKEELSKMFYLSQKSKGNWDFKTERKIDELEKLFCNYFQKNGFDIEYFNSFVKDAFPAEKITATYKTSTFVFQLDRLDHKNFSIDNYDEDISIDLYISLPNDVPNYYEMKENVGHNIDTFLEVSPDDYNDYVDTYYTIEELNELHKKIEINIKHFTESIENINIIELLIYNKNDNKRYKDFNEIINSIE